MTTYNYDDVEDDYYYDLINDFIGRYPERLSAVHRNQHYSTHPPCTALRECLGKDNNYNFMSLEKMVGYCKRMLVLYNQFIVLFYSV